MLDRRTLVPICLILLLALLPAGAPLLRPALAQADPAPAGADLLARLRAENPPSFDLDQVLPERFAAALGHDPEAIFAFVRDAVAFESYPGALRGPRGTLLALAGNSPDRALLLAAMLEAAGQQVRFARGTLPPETAAALVASMWRGRPAPETAAAGTPSPRMEAALATFETALARDVRLLEERLARAGIPAGAETAVESADLLAETRDHWWLQWLRAGSWVDLDPSFADAEIGRAYAAAEETLAALPDALFHRVTIRIVLEEYTADAPADRTILAHTVRAADLAAGDAALLHMPENWAGPTTGLDTAITDAAADTGKLRPALLLGDQAVLGEPFFARPPPTSGLGGLGNLMAGAGTRNPVPLATAERIEFDFLAPDGRSETIVREIFDLVGPGRRAAGNPLSADEVTAAVGAEEALDLAQGIHQLFFSTGRIDAAHLPGPLDEAPTTPEAAAEESPDLLAALRRFNIAHATISDQSFRLIELSGGARLRFYPDSPRLAIAEFSTSAGLARLTLDLRRDRVRVAASGAAPAQIFTARVFRGVFQGTLERALVEYLAGEALASGEAVASLSTSTLLEQAAVQGVPLLLLPGERSGLAVDLSPDALARLEATTARGYLALVPERALPLNGAPRLAWWQVDPATGETVAVTDEGLHQTTFEVQIHHRQNGTTQVTVRHYVGNNLVRTGRYTYRHYVRGSITEYQRDMALFRDLGWRFLDVIGGRFAPF